MTSAPQLLSHHLFAQVVKEKKELLEEELVDEGFTEDVEKKHKVVESNIL